jgi:hypothetical protein
LGSRLVRVVVLLLGVAVIVVGTLVGTSAGWLVGGILTTLGIVATVMVEPEVKRIVERVRSRTFERRCNAVARLWDDEPPSNRPAEGELPEYLRERLLEGRHDDGLALLTGFETDALKRIAESAAAGLRASGVDVIAPSSDSPDDVLAFAGWLIDGADEKVLPHDHDRSTPTLFLLGELERYRDAGLAPGHFERWRQRARLALATALSPSGAATTTPSWDNELRREAYVIPI